jgi:hypothetical protein
MGGWVIRGTHLKNIINQRNAWLILSIGRKTSLIPREENKFVVSQSRLPRRMNLAERR